MTKLHYVYDEDLKVEREYVEVDGKADVGDYVHVSEYADESEDAVAKIDHIDEFSDFIAYTNVADEERFDLDEWDSYAKLVPTNIVRIDGERYEMVERKAEVGEKVIYTGGVGCEKDLTVGKIYEITGVILDVIRDGSHQAEFIDDAGDGDRAFWDGKGYNVLVPVVDEAEEEQAPESDVERLTRQMTSLAASYAKLKHEVALQGKALTEESRKVSEYLQSPPEFTETDAVNYPDMVDSPAHYTQGGIEVIDIIAQTVAGYDDPFVGHCVATSTKYLNRAPYKHDSPIEDIKKGIRYLEFAVEHLEKNKDE